MTPQAAPHISVGTARHAKRDSSPPADNYPSHLADMARLSIKQISAVAGRSEQSIRDKMKAGEFPQPDYRDGPRCVRWSAGLVRKWLESTTTK